MFNEAILIILSTLSISLFIYLIYSLVIYYYNVIPSLMNLLKEYRTLKKFEKDFVDNYKNELK